jgi:hypothetical protein
MLVVAVAGHMVEQVLLVVVLVVAVKAHQAMLTHLVQQAAQPILVVVQVVDSHLTQAAVQVL